MPCSSIGFIVDCRDQIREVGVSPGSLQWTRYGKPQLSSDQALSFTSWALQNSSSQPESAQKTSIRGFHGQGQNQALIDYKRSQGKIRTYELVV